MFRSCDLNLLILGMRDRLERYMRERENRWDGHGERRGRYERWREMWG